MFSQQPYFPGDYNNQISRPDSPSSTYSTPQHHHLGISTPAIYVTPPPSCFSPTNPDPAVLYDHYESQSPVHLGEGSQHHHHQHLRHSRQTLQHIYGPPRSLSSYRLPVPYRPQKKHVEFHPYGAGTIRG